jgi:hypothetical protein
MPSSNIPPEEQQKVKPFDPVVLDRTVIAVPLLDEMQEDLKLIAKIEDTHPDAAYEFNSAIEFNENFPGGAEAAREEALKIAERTKHIALEASTKRLASAPKETLAVLTKRHPARRNPGALPAFSRDRI